MCPHTFLPHPPTPHTHVIATGQPDDEHLSWVHPRVVYGDGEEGTAKGVHEWLGRVGNSLLWSVNGALWTLQCYEAPGRLSVDLHTLLPYSQILKTWKGIVRYVCMYVCGMLAHIVGSYNVWLQTLFFKCSPLKPLLLKMAAYLTHCDWQPVHLILALRTAVNLFYKVRTEANTVLTWSLYSAVVWTIIRLLATLNLILRQIC